MLTSVKVKKTLFIHPRKYQCQFSRQVLHFYFERPVTPNTVGPSRLLTSSRQVVIVTHISVIQLLLQGLFIQVTGGEQTHVPPH